MGKWLDLAASLEADVRDKRDNRDNRDASPSIDPIVPNVPPALSSSIAQGLARLETMAAPRLLNPDLWPGAVADAISLARNGWAAKVLALGWTELELFGCIADRHGDPAGDGLAVWLAGRRLVLIDERSAIAAEGTSRFCFNRRTVPAGAIFIWELS